MVKPCRVVAGAVVAGLLWTAGTASALAPNEQPLQVKSAALTQAGEDLVWQVTLDHPFSPSALARDHRSLCLLLERDRAASVAGQICVAGRRDRASVLDMP